MTSIGPSCKCSAKTTSQGVAKALTNVYPVPVKKAAVVIGVNKTGGLTPLGSAADEAGRVARWLSSEGFDVKKLTDAKRPVTSAAVVKAFNAVVTLPASYHLLVVYFSGHGYWQGRSDIWLLSGAATQPAEAINLRTAMDMARYSGIPNVVFVSDACRTIPNTRGGAYVEGVGGLPSYDEISIESKVDFIKATSEARPAYEGKINGAPRSVLTAALMTAYEEPEAQMVHQVVEGGQTIEVVPNRRLEDFLQRKVDALLAVIDPNAVQQIVANVPSGDDVYIARVKRAKLKVPPPAPPPQPPSRPRAAPDTGRVAADALNSTLSTRTLGPGGLRDVMSAKDAQTEAKLTRRLPDRRLDHYETETGFAIHGVVAARVAASQAGKGLSAELLTPGDGQSAPALVRVQYGAKLRVPQGLVASVGVQFADGRCVVLAALPGYIGHVVVNRNGMSNVSYVPSSNHWRWEEYEKRRAEVDRLRSMVAVAVDQETFALRSDLEAAALADKIRMYKGVDPTLGLYAAHAFSQAGNDTQVRSVLTYMRDDLSADLFDVRVLASRRLEGLPTNLPMTPCCPMLTQTWNLLRARRVDLPAPLQNARRWLCDSLWTTFEAKAGSSIIESINNGALQ